MPISAGVDQPLYDAAEKTSRKRHVAVVGGGVSGLTAAYRLQQAGFAVTVYECSGHAGGRTLSIRRNGYVFDVGAITMLPTYVHTSALLDELGMAARLHRSRPVIGVPREGRIHRLDLAKPVRSLLTTRLLSVVTKLRLLALIGPMRRAWHNANFTSMAPLAPWDNETVQAFARRMVGEEAHEYLMGPIMRGNTLNDTACAPAAELLWMIRQYSAASIAGLDTGINGLAEALAQRVPVEYGARITHVARERAGVGIHGTGPQGKFKRRFDACVVALPPPDVLSLAPPMSDGQWRFMRGIRPLPSVNVHLGLRRAPKCTETFILPPASEQRDLTTIVMDHLKAPGRAPQGHGVVSLYLRDDWGARHMDASDEDVLDEVLRMAEPFIGDVRADIDTYVVQRWRYANVKTQVGLYRSMQNYEAELDANSVVQLAGDFLSQGIESAVISGQAAAERLAKYFKSRDSNVLEHPTMRSVRSETCK